MDNHPNNVNALAFISDMNIAGVSEEDIPAVIEVIMKHWYCKPESQFSSTILRASDMIEAYLAIKDM